MTIAVGSRVCWADEDPDDPENVGTVMEPTVEELAYVASWSPSARASVRGHVIVHWDSDDPWGRAWHDPDELYVYSAGGQPGGQP